MKKYELIDTEFIKTLMQTNENGKVWSIPLDPANSDYAEYLRYIAWVEAENNPEDFWLAEGNEPEVLEG